MNENPKKKTYHRPVFLSFGSVKQGTEGNVNGIRTDGGTGTNIYTFYS
jgi:hypothetical protein